jgi:TusA-related sulfurtransferase
VKSSVLLLTTLPLGFHAGTGFSQTGQEHARHADADSRGDRVMGFSHEKSTHHFRLLPDGGFIEVTANDPADAATRSQIQMHLSHIARMFAEGDFQAPMLVHDKVPPGTPILQRLKASVSYRFEKVDRGGRIRITTTDPEALGAVHEFLRFQISDHQTGDSPNVAPSEKTSARSRYMSH